MRFRNGLISRRNITNTVSIRDHTRNGVENTRGSMGRLKQRKHGKTSSPRGSRHLWRVPKLQTAKPKSGFKRNWFRIICICVSSNPKDRINTRSRITTREYNREFSWSSGIHPAPLSQAANPSHTFFPLASDNRAG